MTDVNVFVPISKKIDEALKEGKVGTIEMVGYLESVKVGLITQAIEPNKK